MICWNTIHGWMAIHLAIISFYNMYIVNKLITIKQYITYKLENGMCLIMFVSFRFIEFVL